MFSCALRSLPAILIDIGPIALTNRLPTATASISPADRDQSSSRGAARSSDRGSAFAARAASIGSSVIRQFVPTSAPWIGFNCLNKPVSAHPSLYGTQVRPYLFTSLSEGPRPPSVLPMRSRYTCLALRCFRASA